MAKKKSIEQAVEQAILQKERTFTIGDKEYKAQDPTIGTLFMVSSLISELPEITDSRETAKVIGTAVFAPQIAKIAAILIIGAKRIKQGRKNGLYRVFGFFPNHHPSSEVDELAQEILNNCTASEAYDIIVAQMQNASLNDFFAVTTFLREANLTKPTKVVKTQATALGRSLQR